MYTPTGDYYDSYTNLPGWQGVTADPITIQPLITDSTDQIFIPTLHEPEPYSVLEPFVIKVDKGRGKIPYDKWDLSELRLAAVEIQIQIEIKEKEERELNMSNEEREMDDIFDMI